MSRLQTFLRWLTENAAVSTAIKTFVTGQRPGSVVSVGNVSFVLTTIGRTLLYKRVGETTPYLYRIDWNPDGTGSARRASRDGVAMGTPIAAGPVKRVSDPPKTPVAEAPVVKFTNWRMPSPEDLALEYKLEYTKKPALQSLTKNAWPTLEDFLASVKQAKPMVITPEIDARIAYRSHTQDKASLRGLLRTYASWGTFRTDQTLNALYDGYKANKPMTMPIVLDFGGGKLRIMGGNTRMDVARQLGIDPKVLVVPVPKGGARV